MCNSCYCNIFTIFFCDEKLLGIILCGEKSNKLIEFLELDKRDIHVAEYLTELSSRSYFSAICYLLLRKILSHVNS